MAVKRPAIGEHSGPLFANISKFVAGRAMREFWDYLATIEPIYDGPVPIPTGTSSNVIAANTRFDRPTADELQNGKAAAGSNAVNVLATRADGNNALANAINETNDEYSLEQMNLLMGIDPETLKEALRLDIGSDLVENGGDELAKAVRGALKRPDRSRVSKEVWEWRYCRDSDAINQIYDIAGVQKENTLNHSYPAWVGSRLMRRVIQRVRLLNRCVKSRNVKKVLDAFDLEANELFTKLAAADGGGDLEFQCAMAVNEFKDILTHTPEDA